mgnify:FL=1
MKKLSLIILTYNSEKDIYDCLSSVYQYNDIGDALEIIVVDNNSEHYARMQDKLSTLYPKVNIISNSTNGGYGQGNNIGIQSASAPIVSIMNPDVRLVMPIFQRILNIFEVQEIVMCGGKQYKNATTPAISFCCDYHRNALLQSIGISYYRKRDIYKQQSMWLSGAFFFIRKKEFEQIGLFDENIFMYGEEYDIHIRLQKMFPNKIIKYLPDLKYIHLIEDRQLTVAALQKTLKSLLYLCSKHNISIRRFLFIQRTTNFLRFCMTSIVRILGRPYNYSNYKLNRQVLRTLK